MDKSSIAFKELDLNIKHQDIQVDEFMTLGYEWDENTVVFVFLVPKKQFSFMRMAMGK